MIGEATKTWLMYHWLKKAGIVLEYLIDGVVDDKFVEPYYYLEERKLMLEEFHESLKLNK